MNLKSFFLGATLAIASSLSLEAAVSFNFDGAYLYGKTFAEPITGGALLVVVTSPTGNYTGPVAGSLISGDEVLLGTFVADEDYLGEPGGFSTALTFDLGAGVVSGKDFALLWFPSLVAGDVPVGGEAYGFYVDPTWVIGAEGDLTNFSFYTQNFGGPEYLAENIGLASFVVPGGAIPEPSTFAAIAGLVVIGAVAARRRRSA